MMMKGWLLCKNEVEADAGSVTYLRRDGAHIGYQGTPGSYSSSVVHSSHCY